MSYITASDVKTRFPEFSAIPDPQVSAAINDTKCNFDTDRWDCLYERGHSLYVAHLLSFGTSEDGPTKSNGSPVSSQTADGVSRSYAVYNPVSASESFLMQSKYGQEYLFLMKSVGMGATCVGI